jgi:hypothetical protein
VAAAEVLEAAEAPQGLQVAQRGYEAVSAAIKGLKTGHAPKWLQVVYLGISAVECLEAGEVPQGLQVIHLF